MYLAYQRGFSLGRNTNAPANPDSVTEIPELAEAYHRYRLQFPGGTLYCGSESGPFEFDSGPCSCRMDMDGVVRLAANEQEAA